MAGEELVEGGKERSLLRFDDGKCRQRNTGSRHGTGGCFGKNGGVVILLVSDLVHKAPLLCLLSGKPTADFHEVEELSAGFLLALGRIEFGHIGIHFLQVGFHLSELLDLLFELVGIQ